MAGNVFVSAQDKPLVFRGWNAGNTWDTDCNGCGCGSSFVWMIPSREKVEKIFAGKEYFGKSAKEKNGK